MQIMIRKSITFILFLLINLENYNKKSNSSILNLH